MTGYEWVWPVIGIISVMVMLLASDVLKQLIRARHRSRARIEQAVYILPQSEVETPERERDTDELPDSIPGLEEALAELGKAPQE